MEIDNLPSLILRYKDDKSCREYLEQILWNGTPKCPHCKFEEKIYRYKDGKLFKCASCKKKFTITVGTPMENSNITLSKWFLAIYLLINNKKGMSSYQLGRHLNITQSNAWFLTHRIRKMFDMEVEPLTGVVEADETYIGGKNKNRHKDKKVKHSQGRSYLDKTPVFGVMERGGKVISMKVPNVKGQTIQPILFQTVSSTSTLMTDEWHAYNGMSNYFVRHGVVFHGRGQYVYEDAYTNNMEAYWSHVKRSIIGCYHSISRKYMNMYCMEFDFRYNTRKMTDGQRFKLAIGLCLNSRLSMDDLKRVD